MKNCPLCKGSGKIKRNYKNDFMLYFKIKMLIKLLLIIITIFLLAYSITWADTKMTASVPSNPCNKCLKYCK